MKLNYAFGTVVLVICLLTTNNCTNNFHLSDDHEIIRIVFDSKIGTQHHYGIPPTPPLAPNFDSLNAYSSDIEAKIKLKSPNWIKYFQELEEYDQSLSNWYLDQKDIERVIVLNTSTSVNETYKKWIIESLKGTNIDWNNLDNSSTFESKYLQDISKYRFIELSQFNGNNLDSIHVGILSFSEVMFDYDMKKAAVYYDWICQGNCGGGNLVILEKRLERWIIIEEIELWVS